MNKAVFLDRDGTLIIDKGYICKVEDVEFIKGVFAALKELSKCGYKLIVITNQSGIGRGYFSEKETNIINEYIRETFKKNDVHIDGFYFCPHYEGSRIKKYNLNCNCRKPKIGLILKAAREHNISVNKSYMIGDKEIDVIAGVNAGMKKCYKVDEEHNLLYYSKIICDT